MPATGRSQIGPCYGHDVYYTTHTYPAGDLETNPGPRRPKFPCGVCKKAVTWATAGIQCDGCDTWLHKTCIGMDTSDYERLGHNSTVWFCTECGLLNISPSLYSFSTVSTANTYTPLSGIHEDSTEYATRLSSSEQSPGPLLHTSSPNTNTSRHSGIYSHRKKTLKIINVN